MTGVPWISTDADAATGGQSTAPWAAVSISIDSRTIQPGDLFVALQGPNFDGHDFVADALAKGAAAAMVSSSSPWGRGRAAEGSSGEGLESMALSAPHPATLKGVADLSHGERKNIGPLLIVKDTLHGLQDLARAARARSAARIIALTGSVGKTGTKEALRHVLSYQGDTHASVASFNNHWGAPLSLALLPETAKYAIFELGMNHPGEIEPLSRLVRPNVAVITNVHAVHLGPMGSIAAIAEAKAEIFAGLEPDGHTIINAETNCADVLIRRSPVKPLIFAPDLTVADAFIRKRELDDSGSTITASILDDDYTYRVPVPGLHNAENSLAVLLSVAAIGANVRAAAEAYATLNPVSGRGDRMSVAVPGGTVTIIDETHNASPVATRAALKVLALTRPAGEGRRIAVLGDMLELGPESEEFHAGLAPDIEAASVDLALLSGSNMAYLYAALPAHLRGGHAADSTRLLPIVMESLRPGDVVLVKGSRGSKMKVITEGLKKRAAKKHAL